ncbi:MAG: hypothetical protein NZ888_03710 [Candidatus Nitrosocaldus sp.]|nr:hypothetical protein [Candidatus Nitrosocaldus sp.]MDW8000238.1 hypothetical protein [Candidatus Nitrosocaldus sp.]
MLRELRKNILRLLKEDEEFRYAVAGLIGLEDIRSSLKRLDDAVARLVETQSKVETRLTGVEGEVKGLKDRVERVETKITGVEGEVKGLKDRVERVEKRFDGLEGALYHGFEQLGRFAGVSLEELVRSIMTKNMRDRGELREGKAITSLNIDGEEIDVFCDDPLIVGEVTSYADSVEEVDKLMKKVNIVRERYGREPARKILIISSVKADAAEPIADKAREYGVELIMGKKR